MVDPAGNAALDDRDSDGAAQPALDTGAAPAPTVRRLRPKHLLHRLLFLHLRGRDILLF